MNFSGRYNVIVNVIIKKKIVSLVWLYIKVIKSEFCIDIYLFSFDVICYRYFFYVESFYIGGFYFLFKLNIEYM